MQAIEKPMKIIGIADYEPPEKEAWLFGKGRSFDFVEWSKVGKFRIGINNAIRHIPDCTMGVSHHDWRQWFCDEVPVYASPASVECGPDYKDDMIKVVPYLPAMHGHTWLIFETQIIGSKPERFEYRERNLVFKRGGTGTSAMHLLCLFGVQKVHLWGFDGGGEYSRLFAAQHPNPRIGLINKTLGAIEYLAQCYDVQLINHGKH